MRLAEVDRGVPILTVHRRQAAAKILSENRGELHPRSVSSESCVLDKSRLDHKPGGHGMGWTQSRFTVSTAAQWSTPTPEKCD